MKPPALAAYSYLNLLRLSGKIELYQPTYNPQNYSFLKKEPGKRVCSDRLSFIEKHLNFSDADSYLDIGCQIGYFVFAVAAKYPLTAYGYDQELAAYSYARALHRMYPLNNVHFKKFSLTPQSAKHLDTFTIISLLSVWHHLVWLQGRSAADNILRQLSRKCKYFIFETGQSNEPGFPWSNSLQFMGKKPRQWLANHLSNLGFTIIAHQEFPTHLSSNSRSLFICKTTV